MKIVINAGYGCDVSEQYVDLVDRYESDRTNPELVAFVENHPNDCGDLVVITIPDNATDWDIQDYDEVEDLIYVVDGKIHHC